MPRARVKYTKELLQDTVNKHVNWKNVCLELGIRPWGGAQTHLARRAKLLGVDTTHFLGQAHSRGKKLVVKHALTHYLTKNSTIKSVELKRRLLVEGIKASQCEICKRTEWEGGPIPLELDHINSDHWDNRLENLQIICPNCHAKVTSERRLIRNLRVGTPSGERLDLDSSVSKDFCAGSTPVLRTKIDAILSKVDRCGCGSTKWKKSNKCKKCESNRRKINGKLNISTKIQWPSGDKLLEMVNSSNYLQVGAKLGVTDNAVRKRLKVLGLEVPRKIRSKFDK